MGQSYFANDGAQPYFILQAALLYFKKTKWYWKSYIMEIYPKVC